MGKKVDILCPILLAGWLSHQGHTKQDPADVGCHNQCSFYDLKRDDCRLVLALEDITKALSQKGGK